VAQSSLRKCKECGGPIIGRRADAKYCSSTCCGRAKHRRNKDYYREYWKSKNKDIVEKKCLHCGKLFKTNKTFQKYCSGKCCKAAWKKKHPESGRFHVKNRYHKKRATSDGSVTFEFWENLKKAYNYTCPVCGKREPEIKLTIDHINL
jgi:hypothetical protein